MGYFAVPSGTPDFLEIKTLQDTANGIIRQVGVYYKEAAFATSQVTTIQAVLTTLKSENKIALFPDAVSERGQKHLKDLIELKQSGHNAAMLYIIGREDVNYFSPAHLVDKKYSELLQEASQQGVQILPYKCKLNESGIFVNVKIPFQT